MSQKTELLIVSHDAGGAEIVSSWVGQNPGCNYTFVLDGPALRIFRARLGEIDVISPADLSRELLERVDFILTGTSWASDIEKMAIKMARAASLPTAAFLDHWCHYVDRFQNGDDVILPDEIWVGDEEALKLARQWFPDVQIELVANPYFIDIRKQFAERQKNIINDTRDFTILYICEAAAESGQTLASGELIEYRSMDLFLVQLRKITRGRNVVVRIRAHPAEAPDKYRRYLENPSDIAIEMSEGDDLVDDCLAADWIVGMNSMALVVAMIGGSKVFYCNIDKAKPKNLPDAGMNNFFHVNHLE